MAESFATGGTVAKKAGRLVQRKKLSPVSRHNPFALCLVRWMVRHYLLAVESLNREYANSGPRPQRNREEKATGNRGDCFTACGCAV